jgi:hypothetical protein
MTVIIMRCTNTGTSYPLPHLQIPNMDNEKHCNCFIQAWDMILNYQSNHTKNVELGLAYGLVRNAKDVTIVMEGILC